MQDEDLFDIDELKSLPKKSIKPMAWVAGVLAICLAVWGIFSRDRDARELRQECRGLVIPFQRFLNHKVVAIKFLLHLVQRGVIKVRPPVTPRFCIRWVHQTPWPVFLEDPALPVVGAMVIGNEGTSAQ